LQTRHLYAELLAKLGVDLGSTGHSNSVRPENYISGPGYALACNHLEASAMQSTVVYTSLENGSEAGRDLGTKIWDALADAPDAVIIFASPKYDHRALLQALAEACGPKVMVGASSAGEFTRDVQGEGMACALALKGADARFAASVGRDLQRDAVAAARQIASGFAGHADHPHGYRSALVMADALAGHAEALVDELTVATAGQYQFFGGGAGDNAQFQHTVVFCGTEVFSDAAVALEILSEKPIGIGVSHGWQPASEAFRVTEAEGKRLISLNGFPAVEAFQHHAGATGQTIDTASPIPFFLHNILGIDVGAGHRLRVPLAVHEDGSVLCASEVPVGSLVRIMRSSENSAIDAAETATEAALQGLRSHPPKAALFFDCVATRLRLGDQFGFELGAVKDRLGGIDLAGCNTHGQIARASGQFDGFHNCTAVVCIFPE
jgi:hypothetical protein